MNDYLLELSRHPFAKKLVKQLKLPIPLPEPLKREKGPWSDAELAGMTFAFGSGKNGKLSTILPEIIESAKGETQTEHSPESTLHGLVYDATGAQTVESLGGLYDFIKPRLKSLRSNGRVLLVGVSSVAAKQPEGAAVSAALGGFVRSLAKEIGKRGATAQLLLVEPGRAADWHLKEPVRFFLSRRSAFISGQTLELSADVPPPGPRGDVMPLKDKTAVVTGAAHGIGQAIARRLAAEGARVMGVDRPTEKDALEALMTEIGGIPCALDLLAPGAVSTLAKRIETEFGALDILVNNAGITRDKTLGRMPRDFWDDVIAVNLTAPVELTTAVPLAPGGRVICMASISGIAGNFGQTNYAAAKAGLIGYVKALSSKVVDRGITVNALAPGFIETRMTKAIPMAVREVARRFNSLNQAGQPEDVAEAAAFLAHPGAFSVTGQVLRVCGQNLVGA